MNLSGTVSNNVVRETVFKGPVLVALTIDRPTEKIVQVHLSNGWRTRIEGDDYDSLQTKWTCDDDLLTFIAAKNNLTVS